MIALYGFIRSYIRPAVKITPRPAVEITPRLKYCFKASPVFEAAVLNLPIRLKHVAHKLQEVSGSVGRHSFRNQWKADPLALVVPVALR